MTVQGEVRVHDSLGGGIKPLETREDGVVRMYNCGPTVYADPHIGNMRSFLFADVLRRHLEARGYAVHQVMNITDVGHLVADADDGLDKMEEAARRFGKDPWAIAAFYADKFFEARDTLRMLEAEAYPRATDHVPHMIEAVKSLLERGVAYEAGGSVYFDVTQFEEYGRLSGNTLEDLTAGARVDVHPDKRHPADFALWKHDPNHIMKWDSPWGEGFPGWHIECSVMSAEHLGLPLDIHTGGEDNVFPHHECEIAQSWGLGQAPLSLQWMHARHLLVDNAKMSKSAGTFITVADVLERGFSGAELRFALTRVHYRKPLNFTWEGMDDARAWVRRFREAHARLAGIVERGEAGDAADDDAARNAAEEVERGFFDALDDDLETSTALGRLMEGVRDLNRLNPGPDGAAAGTAALESADRVLALLEPDPDQAAGDGGGDDAEIDALVQAREDARAARDFAEADRLRDQLTDMGIVVKDTPHGPEWRRE